MKAVIASEMAPKFTEQIEKLKSENEFNPESVAILAALHAREYLKMDGASERELESYHLACLLFTEAVQIAAIEGRLKG